MGGDNGLTRARLLLVLVALSALLVAGCGTADDKGSLASRTGDALIETGASPALTRCLTRDLEDHLTEADADAAYDLYMEPDLPERELNRLSLVQHAVRERLAGRARICRSHLVSQGRYSRREVDRMLRRVGKRGYRKPGLFLKG